MVTAVIVDFVIIVGLATIVGLVVIAIDRRHRRSVIFALLLLMFLILCLRKRERWPSKLVKVATGAVPPIEAETSSSKDEITEESMEGERNKLVFTEGEVCSFGLEDLLRASTKVLGKDSIGSSCKAVLEEGTTLVVKRLKDVTAMGTKLEYCAINPRASSQSSSSRYSMLFKDDYFQIRKLKKNCEPMVEIRVNNMESIKNTMQMHEDMFKHQVRELHRLYSVQKTLMDELKTGIKTNRLCAATSITNQSNQLINTQHFIKTQITCGYDSHVEEADPSSRANSGTCSNGYIRDMKKPSGLDLERPAGEDNSAQDEDTEIELTLSIGGSSKKKKKIANNSKSKPYNQSNGEEIREDFIGLDAPLLSFPWFNHKQDSTPLDNI